VTDEAAPALQRLALGALLTATPFAEPQLPLVSSWAEHLAVEPPETPLQVHDHGPAPDTDEDVPALHKPVVGLLVRSAPFEAPHWPLTCRCPRKGSWAGTVMAENKRVAAHINATEASFKRQPTTVLMAHTLAKIFLHLQA